MSSSGDSGRDGLIAAVIRFVLANRGFALLLIGAIIGAGLWATYTIPVDAIPDLSDVQVIVLTEYPGQAPRIVEDQVTYPLTTKMLAVPHAMVVRGYSFFNYSFVYIIFEDGTDIYWARSRVLEYLTQMQGQLPAGVTPQLGPDATGVGWAFMYSLHSKTRTLQELRSKQDWFLKYELMGLEGVAEVASVGGFVKQYQVVVDPEKLRAYGLSLSHVRMAIQRSNVEAGGRVMEMAETEYMLRAYGYLGTLTDSEKAQAARQGIALDVAVTQKAKSELEQTAVGARPDGTPIRLVDVAVVQVGPEMRRGIAEWNGQGETVGGIVVVRYGADTRSVIELVKQRLDELAPVLAKEDIHVVVGYDRSALIERSIDTLRVTLAEEMAIVAVVIVIFLVHLRSSLVVVVTLPLAVLCSLVVMRIQGVNANIMSLGGIAIAIGAMVDAAIIMIENAHKHLERDDGSRPHWDIIRDASIEVGPTLFFSLLVITVSFLPIFTLEQQEGRLFKPLALTKTYAMAFAAILAVVITPAMMGYLVRHRTLPDSWSRWRRLAITLVVVVLPALVLSWWANSRPAQAYDGGLGWLHAHWLTASVGWVVLVGLMLLPQRIFPEQQNPIARALIWAYAPFVSGVLSRRWLSVLILLAALALIAITFMPPIPGLPQWTVGPYHKLGSEFMPPLYEGDLLYMPTTLPGISVTKARELLQQTDALIKTFPEVHHVFGKIGRAETATDPAPLSMIETTIMLKPPGEWRTRQVQRWWAALPSWLHRPFDWAWPLQRHITPDELIYGWDEPDGTHVPGLDDACKFPGLTNAWTMPIKTRIDMLSTGIKTPIGIKISGPDLVVLEKLGEQIEAAVRDVPGTASAYAERVMGGNYVVFDINREQIARFGLTVRDVQEVISSAVGGMNITQTVEGLERYPVNLRYSRELRDNLDALRAVLVSTATGQQIPLGQLAGIEIKQAAPAIKSENSRPNCWVYVDIRGIDVGSYVTAAKAAVAARVELPPGYKLTWSGQYEYMQRANERLTLVLPVTGVIIILLLFLNTRSWIQTGIVLLTVPFSLVGSFWFMYWLDYNLSIAVWVGIIALAGLAAETGVVMLMYLDQAWRAWQEQGRMRTRHDLQAAIFEGAVQRIRPKTMAVMTTMLGLVPILWSTGTGADVMKRMAAPMVGGLITSFVMELVAYPIIFYFWKLASLRRGGS